MSIHLESRKILRYEDLISVAVDENEEPLVPVQKYDKTIIALYQKQDMIRLTGHEIFVRDAVARMLAHANQLLSPKGLHLHIVYGYRHPSVQKAYFTKRRIALEKDNPGLTGTELNSLTHSFVASPDVAGHPTGGAVDITLADAKGPLAMGTNIADYTHPERIVTYATDILPIEAANRKLLHDTMTETGFAPFYGEWWHFSYGDREWAEFYHKPSSLYQPINFINKQEDL